jgi:hypothetical protein
MHKKINDIEFKTLSNDERHILNGTSLQGYIITTKQNLEEMFGTILDPTVDGKVTREWGFVTRNIHTIYNWKDEGDSSNGMNAITEGIKVTIYNWKDEEGISLKNPQSLYEWNIGGHDRLALYIVKTLMPGCIVKGHVSFNPNKSGEEDFIPSLVPTPSLGLEPIIRKYLK